MRIEETRDLPKAPRAGSGQRVRLTEEHDRQHTRERDRDPEEDRGGAADPGCRLHAGQAIVPGGARSASMRAEP